jgi:hypothetical protein
VIVDTCQTENNLPTCLPALRPEIILSVSKEEKRTTSQAAKISVEERITLFNLIFLLLALSFCYLLVSSMYLVFTYHNTPIYHSSRDRSI